MRFWKTDETSESIKDLIGQLSFKETRIFESPQKALESLSGKEGWIIEVRPTTRVEREKIESGWSYKTVGMKILDVRRSNEDQVEMEEPQDWEEEWKDEMASFVVKHHGKVDARMLGDVVALSKAPDRFVRALFMDAEERGSEMISQANGLPATLVGLGLMEDLSEKEWKTLLNEILDGMTIHTPKMVKHFLGRLSRSLSEMYTVMPSLKEPIEIGELLASEILESSVDVPGLLNIKRFENIRDELFSTIINRIQTDKSWEEGEGMAHMVCLSGRMSATGFDERRLAQVLKQMDETFAAPNKYITGYPICGEGIFTLGSWQWSAEVEGGKVPWGAVYAVQGMKGVPLLGEDGPPPRWEESERWLSKWTGVKTEMLLDELGRRKAEWEHSQMMKASPQAKSRVKRGI